MRFLPFGYRFDWPEFLLGIAFALVIHWLLTRSKTFLQSIKAGIIHWGNPFQGQSRNVEKSSYQRQLVAYMQSLHLAAPLFQFNKIILRPHLLIPPAQTNPVGDLDASESRLQVLPAIPDWNPLTAIFSAPSFPIEKLIGRKINVLITGEPGSGRTSALAYLTFHLFSPEYVPADPSKIIVPVYVHSNHFTFPGANKKAALDTLLTAIKSSVPFSSFRKTRAYIRDQIVSSQILLLLDGIDELSQQERANMIEWLRCFRQEHPGIQIIASGSFNDHDLFKENELVPVPLAPWNPHQAQRFLQQWGVAWQEYARAHNLRRLADINPALINAWIVESVQGRTAFETTLFLWSAYAGDFSGIEVTDSIATYIARMLSPSERETAEQYGYLWLMHLLKQDPPSNLASATSANGLIDAGLIRPRSTNRYSFYQPSLGAYLAARYLISTGTTIDLVDRHNPNLATTWRYVAAHDDQIDLINEHLAIEDPILQRGVLSCGRWLFSAPSTTSWRPVILKNLAQLVAESKHPFGLRLRALNAIVHSGDGSVARLFQHMLARNSVPDRILASLGLGSLHDPSAVPELVQTLRKDQNQLVRISCMLALGAIGSERAIETLAHLLLQGSESVQAAAARALAVDSDEGYQVLKDAIEHNNPAVRRAAVYGLEQVHTDWVEEILRKHKLDDDEWIVRNAALEISERREKLTLDFAPLASNIADLPWLLTFAADKGLGVAPGRGASEVLRQALSTGSSEYHAAALQTLAWHAHADYELEINQALSSSDEFIRDTAFETLWAYCFHDIKLG